MTDYKNLLCEAKDGILTIIINREPALNALDRKTLLELKAAFEDADENESVRGVILTGQGEKAFVAGADIKELAGITEINARAFAEDGQEIFLGIENLSKPVIAVVNGFALGGGCELAMACHMRIATQNAKFGLPEVTLGILPGYGGTQRLTTLVGKGRAMEITMTGNMVDAASAHAIGLVNHVEETKDIAVEKAKELLSSILEKAPTAISEVIMCINASTAKETDGYQAEANAFARLCATEDFKEGTAAFIEKRKPKFAGK